MMADWLPLAECKTRRLYRLHSRNLTVGVFDGENGFLGIRQKFDARFVFTEHHWDQDYFPTAKPVEDMGIDLPEDIELRERFDSVDRNTGRTVAFDFDSAPPEADIADYRGWHFTDTGEFSDDIAPVAEKNKALFDWLERYTDDGEPTQP